MKNTLITAIVVLSAIIVTHAQAKNEVKVDTTDIRFEQQLKWSEVLAKAKAEHKYIFIDCYASWCVPCKWMETNVYNQGQVAEVYNKQFISWKIQMDQTPKDDSLTKIRYDRAKTFQQNYNISAYPTFLFFNPDGEPVHKVSGSLDIKAFIQLAADAQNPDKQYYAILKNFQPGTLDTAEEKGLAWSFMNSDKKLAGQLAADYLSRIPRSHLRDYDNCLLMSVFQNNPIVLKIVVAYVSGLDQSNFKKNTDLISALGDQQQVKDLVFKYLSSLSKDSMGNQANLTLISRFNNDSRIHLIGRYYIDRLCQSEISQEKNLQLLMDLMFNGLNERDAAIQQIAARYINRLPQDSLFLIKNLRFLFGFTQSTTDRGFSVFYYHSAKVDSVMNGQAWGMGKWKVGNAVDVAREVIKTQMFEPFLKEAKISGVEPDFDKIEATISTKFNRPYADQIIINGKIDWYGYLINTKKMSEYWTQLIRWQMKRIEEMPPSGRSSDELNNLCYEIFQHGDEQLVLDTAVQWMKSVLLKSPNDAYDLDTYACVLYKAGNKEAAEIYEQKSIDQWASAKLKSYVIAYSKKLELMKSGGPIWTMPEFQ